MTPGKHLIKGMGEKGKLCSSLRQKTQGQTELREGDHEFTGSHVV